MAEITSGIFFNNILENDKNKEIIQAIEHFAQVKPNQIIYLINAPLIDKYEYSYQENVLVILSPNYKVIFIDLNDSSGSFETFCSDFIYDLHSISDKYKYKYSLGRPRIWEDDVTTKMKIEMLDGFEPEKLSSLFMENKLSQEWKRRGELIISLLIGSINDIEKIGVEEPLTALEKVRKNIILFDGDQTRFIYKEYQKKRISIQGLSGTGKTELLLHKLKELYLEGDSSRIFFTCHNRALANNLAKRVPEFFNFMKVEKQIEWNKRLWVNRAWGSNSDRNSGLYVYLCKFYKLPFLTASNGNNYQIIFQKLLDGINAIPEESFECALDYILIDERQDFPKIFFDICEKVTSKKIFIAGDVFQNIFDNIEEQVEEYDVILNRCYRTDPRTLMFAQAVGLGLFEQKKINWFPDSVWETIGYTVDKSNEPEIHLSRMPIRRFENIVADSGESVVIRNSTHVDGVIEILRDILKNYPDIKPHEIAIILLDDNRSVYAYIDYLIIQVQEKLKIKVNRANETKLIIENELYVTNANNAKGLEFPFAICVSGGIKSSIRSRNILYTMLSRSFIQSYLLVESDKFLDENIKGLKAINEKGFISTNKPSEVEIQELKENIRNYHVKSSTDENLSYKEWLGVIFDTLKIHPKYREKFEQAIVQAEVEKFDSDQTIRFIEKNQEFYCK